MEEAAIAKGVRRITAVTRQAAIDAYGAAEALRDEFGVTRSLPVEGLGPVLTALGDKVSAAVIPASAKIELREQLAVLQAASLEAWKAGNRQRAKAATDAIMGAAADLQVGAAATGTPALIVMQVPLGDDVKMASKVAATVTSTCPNVGVMLVSTEEDKVYVVCGLPEAAVAAGLSASEWLNQAVGVLGGRGGGKANTAQGQAVGAARVAEVVAAGQAYGKK